MGVPKFYRWISERYPCLSEVVREYQIPEFDNLYLDMNGIIHNCSHPNDDDVHFRITEEKIFSDIFHYIEILFRLIRPRKVFFMAIDGVAPRAKMNQQRGRRFRSAREAIRQEEEAKRKGEALPNEERFDSNCITPGTEFMVKLQEQLKYFVVKKVSSDPIWQGCQIILSGHETPGEGEHKIMEYIRYKKSQPDFSPNTRHCLYGLDADLMMLGLATHEPHFSLLREEVRFGGSASQKRATTPEETTFHLLHLSLMREYLDYEFSDVKGKIPFGYNLENIIDDWILMGFLVGNDFIPNLPHFHIAKGALPILYRTYMSVLPTLDGYINENGKLNMVRFEKFMKKLSEIDLEYFQEVHENNKFLHSKRSKAKDENSGFKPVPSRSSEVSKFLQEQQKRLNEELGLSDDGESETEESDSGQSIFDMEFAQHKKAYYKEKLDGDASAAYLKDQAESYVRAIQWNLYYYYNGVASWSWYFPHHYAPFVSDITGFADLDLKFDLSQPFLPYQQLLGVLPAASRKLLPQAFQNLMMGVTSPILDFYPTDFETDLNGKQQDWEAVVLIPFIDEKRLITAMEECESYLTDEEKKRNSHGPMYSYVYTPQDLGRYDAPGYFGPVMHSHAKCSTFTREDLAIEPSNILRGLCPGVRLDLYFQGFPTLKHIPHKFYLKEAKVKVFQQPSMGWNMLLEIMNQEEVDLKALSEQLIGNTVYVEWPHLIEAKVVALADLDTHYSRDPKTSALVVTVMNKDLQSVWGLQESSARDHYSNRFGIKIGNTTVLVYATVITGRTYTITNEGRVTLEKMWAKESKPYPLQTVVRDLKTADENASQFETLEDLYPVGSMGFVLAGDYYGAPARVIEHLKEKEAGKLRVNIEMYPNPRFKQPSIEEDYVPGFVVGRELGISGHLVSRITGTVFIVSNENKKYNIGLNLKSNKKNEEVPGWTKKVEKDWCYSYKTQHAVEEMKQKFPELFELISNKVSDDCYKENEVFPGNNSAERLKALTTWVASLPCQKVERQKCGTPYLEQSAVKAIEEIVKATCCKERMKSYKSKVKPKVLYRPSVYQGSALPDHTTVFQLYDRVVNVRDGFCVPQGAHGTVIGVRNFDKNIRDVVLEVVFDQEFVDGMSVRGCSPGKGYLMPSYTLINKSHGDREFRRLGSGQDKTTDSVPAGMKLSVEQTTRSAQGGYSSVPPPSVLGKDRGDNQRQNQSSKFRGRQDENGSHAQKYSASGQQSSYRSQANVHPVREAEIKEERPSFAAARSVPPVHVSLQEAAKKLPKPMQFVKGEVLPGNTQKTTEELSRDLQAVLRIGDSAASVKETTPRPPEPQSISFEALAFGSRPPVPVETKSNEPSTVSVQTLLNSGRGPQRPPPMTSDCLQLMDILSRTGLGAPHYEYMPRGNGVQAILRLRNGLVFQGDVTQTREQAAESAARYALTGFQRQNQGFHPFPPPGVPMAVPMPNPWGHGNAPVRIPGPSFGGQPPFLGFTQQPGMPHQYPPGNVHRQRNQRPNSAFVPTQVQRQAVVVRKPEPDEKKEIEAAPLPPPPVAQADVRGAPGNQRSQQHQDQQPRRDPRKARIAARFSNK